MDEVFGDATGAAKADIERQQAIHRRLGLLDVGGKTERSSGSLSNEAEK